MLIGCTSWIFHGEYSVSLGFLLFLGMAIYHDCAHRIPRKVIHIFFYLFRTVWETAKPGMVFNVFNVFHILCDSFCILRGKSTSQKQNTFHIPRCSIYIWLIYVVNVGTYSIHGAYGICHRSSVDFPLAKPGDSVSVILLVQDPFPCRMAQQNWFAHGHRMET